VLRSVVAARDDAISRFNEKFTTASQRTVNILRAEEAAVEQRQRDWDQAMAAVVALYAPPS
jgi:hypothetical protein